MIEPLLTARQVAELLGISADTVLDRVQDGSLPHFRLFARQDKRGRPTGAVRFRESEIAEWIELQREVKS